MSLAQAKALLVLMGITLISGVADAQGFIHASAIWQDGRLSRVELAKSALGFSVGIATYWLSLRYMKVLGVVAPEIQTLIWFAVTLIGVALVSGRVFRWPRLDQAVAVLVLLGVGWLLVRTGS